MVVENFNSARVQYHLITKNLELVTIQNTYISINVNTYENGCAVIETYLVAFYGGSSGSALDVDSISLATDDLVVRDVNLVLR